MSAAGKMPERMFIMYDGRAEVMDTDDCAVLEACGESWRRGVKDWREHDAVLALYDIAPPNQLVNERIIGHVSLGMKELERRIRAASTPPVAGSET